MSNPLLLAQMLNSVIANALEAMPDGGTMIIQSEWDDTRQWLHLTIDDTGEGLTRQQQMRAFKSFYTTKQGRLGIGLIMVKQIMESFGGEVIFTNREKQGTSVRLSFRTVGKTSMH